MVQEHGNVELTEEGRTKTKNPLRYFFDKRAGKGYVPNRELFDFSLALGGQNANYAIVSGWLFYFCTNVLHISAVHVGIVMAVARIWDGVNDPIVGAFIDRAPPRNGKKLHHYLGKLPIVIGIFTVFLFVDWGVGETWSIVFLLTAYIAYDMAYSFQDVALWGTLSLISPHSGERTRSAQWLNIGAQAGSAIVGIIPMLMTLSATVGMSERTLFFLCALIFGFGGEMVSVLAVKTNERILHPPVEKKESILSILKDLRHNKILICLIAAQTLNGLSITVPWIYFFKYCVSYEVNGTIITGEMAQFWYGIASGLPGTIALFVAARLANKLGGMKRTLVIAQISSIIMRVISFFIGYDTIPKLVIVALLMAASSLPSGIMGIANRSLLCDSIDYVEWKTGKRTEGMVSSLQNFVAKIGSALQMLINGLVLGALGFDGTIEGIAGQPDAFYKWQWPLFILGPAVGAFLYLIPVMMIHYSKEQKAQVEKELEQRRVESAQK